MNVDRFLIISGQRNFLTEQKQHFIREVDRLTALYKKFYYKKRIWKNKFLDKQKEANNIVQRFEKEIQKYQEKELIEKVSEEVQTDMDWYSLNKMIKNHETVTFFKRIVILV